MSVIFCEGFDHVSAAQIISYKGWAFASGSTLSVQTGRLAGQAARPQSTDMSHSLPSTYADAIVGDAIKLNGTALNSNLLALRAGGTVVAAVRLVTSGANTVWRVVNSAGTTLATGTTPIVTGSGVWYYLELKVHVSATVGTVELRLNGASTAECSATGVNTGASNIDNVLIAGTSGFTDHDDTYVVDTSGSSPTNTFLGDARVETSYPTANGANTAWTGAFGDVDDASPNDDTDYISSSTPGDRETYTITDISVSTGVVYAVQTNLVARKDDAGVRTIAPVIRISGTDYDGTTTAGLSTSYLGYQQIYDRLDPSGAAWSIATVNAMEAGVKEVA
jgi:hypothetical protein